MSQHAHEEYCEVPYIEDASRRIEKEVKVLEKTQNREIHDERGNGTLSGFLDSARLRSSER